jgi:tetratricopeptide (TPR) repeat protein
MLSGGLFCLHSASIKGATMKRLAAIALLVSLIGNGWTGATFARPSESCINETSAYKAFKANPNSFAALELGLSLACHHKLPQAIALFRQIIQKDPAFAAGFDVYTDLGHALRKQGKIKEAIAAYETAIQHRTSPQSGAYQALSELLRQEGRIQESDAVLKKMPILDPEGAV